MACLLGLDLIVLRRRVGREDFECGEYFLGVRNWWHGVAVERILTACARRAAVMDASSKLECGVGRCRLVVVVLEMAELNYLRPQIGHRSWLVQLGCR